MSALSVGSPSARSSSIGSSSFGGVSFVDRVDARAKILAAILVAGAVVVAPDPAAKGAIVLGLLTTWFIARLSVRSLLVTLGSLGFFFLTTLVLRGVIRSKDAADRVVVGGIGVSPTGLLDGLQMCLQILGIVLALVILVRATAPTVLAEGIELLLRPLRRFGVPAHEGALMFSIALRFLPLMASEFARLQTAQLARGGGAHRRGLLRRVRSVLPLLLPLFIVTLVRARELSEAMDARGYRGEEGRTRIRASRFGAAEWSVVLLTGAAALGAVLLAVLA